MERLYFSTVIDRSSTLTEDGSRGFANALPTPGLRFEVKWDSVVMTFREISGLDVDTQPVTYRIGPSHVLSTQNMPGLKKYSNIILKKGVFQSDDKVWQWVNEIRMNTIKRKSITITLLDDSGKAVRVWALANAWPIRITGVEHKAYSKEVSVESIEIALEGCTIV